jgi:RNA polymerase sigma-70 factor (ECF subfamily)
MCRAAASLGEELMVLTLDQLLEAFAEDRASAGELGDLEALLKNNADARKALVQRTMMDVYLRKALQVLPANSDSELVLRAINGDSRAHHLLVERHYSTAVAAAYSVLSNSEEAKDCAQEAFLEAARSLGDLRERSKFGQWIYGIAYQQAVLVLRRKKRHREAMQTKAAESGGVIAVSVPSEQMARSEKLTSIRKALSETPEIYREVLILKYIEERSHEEIAGILNLSLAAVDKRLMRGKSLLRESLQRWKEH